MDQQNRIVDDNADQYDEAEHGQHVERARYEADLAQRRFLKVDPDNRLVADALEADWNERLRALAAAQEVYEKATAADSVLVTDAERAELLALATDFPRLWHDPRTQMKEKKRMLRLLIEDVTLTKGDALHVDIRFAGGATRSFDVPLPKSCTELRTTDAEVVTEIDRLIDTDSLQSLQGETVARHGIADVVIRSKSLVALDEYKSLPKLGRFVLLDGYDVVGGGLISTEGYPDHRDGRSARPAFRSRPGNRRA